MSRDPRLDKISFRNKKVQAYFMKMCHNSPRITVDWKKFRELDTKGVFSKFTNEQLSMRFRRYNLMDQGLCWYCGVKEATENNGTCTECSKKVKASQHSYLHKEKE